MSLAGDLLVVGAPGYDSGSGAAYVFQRWTHRWREKKRLLPLDTASPTGQQFGSAVATDGAQIFVGAPTADLEDTNTGAVHWFVRSAAVWDHRGLLEAGDLVSGDQLGSSLALAGDFLVAGAPAPPPGTGTGRVHLFRRDGASWEEARLVPGNAEIRDLGGFAAAVDGERVVVGGVLGDQGDGAAGAAWSFRCPAGDACTEEAEAVVREYTGTTFGVAAALTDRYLAVGAPSRDEESAGLVYLYRRAGTGWRQETRLTSLDSGFGASLALDGRRLAVGAPRGQTFPNGAVYLFSHAGGSWAFEHGFRPEIPSAEEAFGTSVALAGDVVAIGAPRGGFPGAVYVWEEVDEDWKVTGGFSLGEPGNDFGAAVSLRDKVLVIGAPGESFEDPGPHLQRLSPARRRAGAIYIAHRGPEEWSLPRILPGVAGPGSEGFGSSVSIGDGVLAAGTPGLNRIHLVEETGGVLGRQQLLNPGDPEVHEFGASLSLLGARLAVGAPDPEGKGRAFLFELDSGDQRELMPPVPLDGDGFGAALALSSRFIVVTSPGPARGDRVTVFELLPEEGGNP